MALWLAQKINAVIVNCDSQQVYKDLQIISARPTPEEEKLVPHYLFGVLEAAAIGSAGWWLKKAEEVIANNPSRPIIFVGGTGMYLQVLMNGIAVIPAIPQEIKDKVRGMEYAAVAAALGEDTDINPRRNIRALEVLLATGKPIKYWHKNQPGPKYKKSDFLTLVMNVSRETLYERINKRFEKMIKLGAIAEVQKLAVQNLDKNLPIMKAIGVPEIISYINKEITIDEAIAKAQQFSRNYAKRQLTWMRRQISEKIEVQNMSFEDIYNLVKKETNF